jgi:hypothetical protein
MEGDDLRHLLGKPVTTESQAGSEAAATGTPSSNGDSGTLEEGDSAESQAPTGESSANGDAPPAAGGPAA